MPFALTADQIEIRDTVRRYLAGTLPLERVAGLAASETGWDPSGWADLAEMGWLGIAVPEESGGVGLGYVEQAIVVEELGRALYSGPYLSTVAALPSLEPAEQAKVAEGSARWSVAVSGLVPDFDRVDSVLGAGSGSPGACERLESIDPTRPTGRITGGAQDAQPPTVNQPVLQTLLAAEALGIAERALDMGVEYAVERQQFGRAIGSYQAISHQLADSFGDLELARSLVYASAWTLSEQPAEAARSAAVANAFTTERAVAVVERVIQVHGGIGFTWEHPLHYFYKRAVWLRAFAGYPSELRSVIRSELAGCLEPRLTDFGGEGDLIRDECSVL